MRSTPTRRRLACLALAAALAPACRTAPAAAVDPWSATSVYELRDYHFDPAQLDAYRAWIERDFLPFAEGRLDVVGFWIATDDPAQVGGAPLDELGPANVTWVLRWPDVETRQRVMGEVLASPEFADVFARVPGGAASYLRTQARFATSVAPPARARD